MAHGRIGGLPRIDHGQVWPAAQSPERMGVGGDRQLERPNQIRRRLARALGANPAPGRVQGGGDGVDFVGRITLDAKPVTGLVQGTDRRRQGPHERFQLIKDGWLDRMPEDEAAVGQLGQRLLDPAASRGGVGLKDPAALSNSRTYRLGDLGPAIKP